MAVDKKVFVPATREQRLQGRKIIVILEGAGLEVLSQKQHKSLCLLNSNSHRKILQALERADDDIRPDITHQCLIALQGSPLNLSGNLAVYIHTSSNQLIEVSPHLIIPKTWQQFESLMVTLLQRKSIRATNANVNLLRIVKNDIDSMLPAGRRSFALSATGEPVILQNYMTEKNLLNADSEKVPLVFYIGAVAKTNPTGADKLQSQGLVEATLAISDQHLTAATVCGKICHLFEEAWNIV